MEITSEIFGTDVKKSGNMVDALNYVYLRRIKTIH